MVTPISRKYTASKTLANLIKSVDSNLKYYVLVRCDWYLKLKSVTIEKSDRNSFFAISTLVSRLPG